MRSMMGDVAEVLVPSAEIQETGRASGGGIPSD